MRSYPSVDVRRRNRHHKKKHRRKQARKSSEPVETRQSWFGTLSLLLGLIALFVLTIQGLVWLQAQNGSPAAMRMIIPWVSRLEILTAIGAILLALVSMPFSARRQRNAVLGLLLGISVLATWIWLMNWKWVL
jgi:hypothetical protein